MGLKVYASKDYVEESISKHSSFGNGHLTFKNIEGKLPKQFDVERAPVACIVGNKCMLLRNSCDYYVHSDDGYNYSTILAPNSYISSIAYGNGRFVGLCNLLRDGATVVVCSNDGYNWTESSIPAESDYGMSIIYFNNMFIVAADNVDGAALYVSEDGVVWNGMSYSGGTSMISLTGVDSLAAGNRVCVAVGCASVNLDYSISQYFLCIDSDLNINQVEIPYEKSRSGTHKVVFGNGIFVESWNGSRFSYSADGMSWTEFTLPFTIELKTLTFCGGKFIATSGTNIVTSEDGLNWDVYENCISNGVFKKIIYFNDNFIAFTNSLDIYYSKDAKIWTSQEKFLKQGDIDVTESFKEYLNIPTTESVVSEVLAALPTWTGGSY